MSEEPAPLTDEEVAALKRRYRAGLNRLAAGLALAGLCAALLILSVEAVLARGPRPVFLWGPAAVELMLLVVLAGRRRWGLALVCAAGLAAQLHYLPQAAARLR